LILLSTLLSFLSAHIT